MPTIVPPAASLLPKNTSAGRRGLCGRARLLGTGRKLRTTAHRAAPALSHAVWFHPPDLAPRRFVLSLSTLVRAYLRSHHLLSTPASEPRELSAPFLPCFSVKIGGSAITPVPTEESPRSARREKKRRAPALPNVPHVRRRDMQGARRPPVQACPVATPFPISLRFPSDRCRH